MRRLSRSRSARCERAAVSAWIMAARVLPRLVTQLASTAVPPVTAAIAEVHTVLSPT
ncbi:hypothetical protein Stube_13840 [Streptomyces tubercidicus]|uniref:Uncharacterized protein n=1 Tax=Streptomyces tubercidicus TaxID=47759 RepID=A0A640UPS4_9ACTN|nr:hypothetical protein Stube_13840 [Streptomyces tubercidicus]